MAELKEYVGRVKEIADETEGASFKGVSVPTSEWNGVLLIEGASFDNVLGIYKAYIKKYGAHPKISLAKIEMLLTLEELGY